jgi:oxygen-independent coproporphyrinogen-3 oxidase
LDPTTLPRWQWPRAAYIHVPFCAHHCGYCDFAIAVNQDDRVSLYLEALEAELATLEKPQPVATIHIGGGTPTHLSAGQLDRLLTSLQKWLPLRRAADDSLPSPLRGRGAGGDGAETCCSRTPHPQPLSPEYRGEGSRIAAIGLELVEGVEFAIEANPDSLDPDKVNVLSDHGVTRVSLGAQSFHPHLLKVLERVHSPSEVPRAVAAVRKRIPQVSLDLIFGVPGQTEQQWREDLAAALALEPDHLSTYGLTFEKGTPLWKQRQRGALQALDEDAELTLYKIAIDTLEAAGFEHYEISNFAIPGRRSRHNQTYWANEAYFGFGMGAARYVLGKRELNTRDLNTYLRRILSGESATFQSEILEPFARAQETMAVQLRRSDGIDRSAYLIQTAFDLDAVAGSRLALLVDQGLLSDDGRHVRLTRPGKYVADAVIERLL